MSRGQGTPPRPTYYVPRNTDFVAIVWNPNCSSVLETINNESAEKKDEARMYLDISTCDSAHTKPHVHGYGDRTDSTAVE